MKELLMMLFFSKSILLTPQSVNLDGILEIKPKKKLTAITSGAHLKIDVTEVIGPPSGILETWDKVKKQFPSGIIEAELYSDNNQPIILFYEGYSSMSTNEVWIDLYSDSGIPTNVKFNKILLRSQIKIPTVKVIWVNFKK